MTQSCSRIQWVCAAAIAILLTLLATSLVGARRIYTQRAHLLLEPINLGTTPQYVLGNQKGHQYDILFFGDSRVTLWKPKPELHGARTIWQGANGQTTAQMKYHYAEDVLALDPDIVVIHAGINDLVAGAMTDRMDKVLVATADNIRMMAQASVENGSEVVILTVVRPRRPPLWRWLFWSRSMPDHVEDLNGAIRSLANQHVHILDADRLLAGGSSYLPRSFATDTLHFSAPAYDAINVQLTRTIEEILNAVQ